MVMLLVCGAVGHADHEEEYMEWRNDNGKYILRWRRVEHGYEFNMTAQTTGWIAVGFSRTRKMAKTDMMIGSVDSSGATLGDFYAPLSDTPDFDAQQDGEVISSFESNGWTSISFFRLDNTEDQDEDEVISNCTHMLWGFGFKDLEPIPGGGYTFDVHLHENRHAVEFDFDVGSAEDQKEANQERLWKAIHGNMMIIAWVLLAVWSSMLPAYMKKTLDVWWFYAHIGMNIAILVLSLLATGLIFYMHQLEGESHVHNLHQLYGYTILLGVVVQSGLGVWSHVWWNPNREVVPLFPDKIHWWFGRVLIVVAWCNVILGLQKFGEKWNALSYTLLYLWFALVAAYVVIFEIYEERTKSESADLPVEPPQFKESYADDGGASVVVESYATQKKATFGLAVLSGLVVFFGMVISLEV
eukprot:CAMPEP_0119125740 /NCGR_PEP_ID=MMETSP1310-20130426/4912_1 /TAXON_ID=464262 /ORGANISM="Genus nov. species nov., Strain RCC2339" /LENGTH=412 /DNA_ID=CAMNT_0007115841 /DNA_START=24 /DNA_END=1258 /DNA_ORIENTATION=-